MYVGIAGAKTERLNYIVKPVLLQWDIVIMKVLKEEGNWRHDIMCIKVFVFSLMREEKNEITSLIEDLNFEWGFFHSLFVLLMNANFF